MSKNRDKARGTTMRHLLIPALTLAVAGQAAAQQAGAPLRDPWIPPAVAASATIAPETRGAALQAQVNAKLMRQFQEADATKRGALSLEEAKRAGFGFAVEHFARIDTQGRGEIRAADLQRYVQRLQAQR